MSSSRRPGGRRWWSDRDILLGTSLVLGLSLGHGAARLEWLALPALAVVMTLSTLEVPGAIFRQPRALIRPMLVGLVINFGLLGGLMLGLSALMIRDAAIATGFVLMAASPPAVAVLPFTDLLRGDRNFSLVATLGCYLGALVITPLMALALLGDSVIQPGKVLVILLELIVAPLLASRVLLRLGWAEPLFKVKGTVTNWCFFIVTYIIVGLNRHLILEDPLALVPAVAVAVLSTFVWGEVLERGCRRWGIAPATTTSLVLLGTLKNYGLAGGLALALFDTRTAVPATVATIFMIVYIIWLARKQQRFEKNAGTA